MGPEEGESGSEGRVLLTGETALVLSWLPIGPSSRLPVRAEIDRRGWRLHGSLQSVYRFLEPRQSLPVVNLLSCGFPTRDLQMACAPPNRTEWNS